MTVLFLVLIILSCVILGFIILVQNPKGGGLAGNVAGFSNQFMGVKQTNDVLEKGTWIFSTVIALLALFSTFFMSGKSNSDNDILNKINTTQGTTPSRQTVPTPAQQQTAPPATNQRPQ
jgi:preprotein translocase subunit SecG